MQLRDTIALVTGASRGIGRATALTLAEHGADVALAARTERDLERVADEVRARGRRALVVPTDIAEREAAERVVPTVSAEWGRVDVVVANAGAYIRQPALQLTADQVQRSLDVNFFGAFHPILSVLPQMVERRRGHVVIVSSLDGRRAVPGDGPYAIAKAALSGLLQIMRQELRPLGIGVTGVFPGRIDTAMIADLRVPWISKKVAPEAVARRTVAAIEHDRPEVVVPAFNRVLLYSDALSPRFTEWAIAHLRLSGQPKN